MGGKPRRNPKREFNPKNFNPSKLSRADLIEICGEMAAVIRLTAQHGKMPEGFTFSGSGDGGDWMMEKPSVTERAFDCLDSVGQIVDREKYYAAKEKKSRKRR